MGGNNKKIYNKMLEDEEIIIRPVTLTMKLYGVSHPVVIEIRTKLQDILMKKEGWEYLRSLEKKKSFQRVFNKVLRIEKRYPGILYQIISTKVKRGRGNSAPNLTKIASSYGLTKQRISQIRQLALRTAELLNITQKDLLNKVRDNLMTENESEKHTEAQNARNLQIKNKGAIH